MIKERADQIFPTPKKQPEHLSSVSSSSGITINNIFKNENEKFNSKEIAFVVENNRSVTFEKCIFDRNYISCLIMPNSQARFVECTFKGDLFASIYALNCTKLEIEDCKFENISGTSFIIYNTYCRVYNTIITNSSSPAICITGKKSKALFSYCEFNCSKDDASSVICQNFSRSLFYGCSFSECQVPSIIIRNNSISQYFNCNITINSTNEYFMDIYENSKVTLYNINNGKNIKSKVRFSDDSTFECLNGPPKVLSQKKIFYSLPVDSGDNTADLYEVLIDSNCAGCCIAKSENYMYCPRGHFYCANCTKKNSNTKSCPKCGNPLYSYSRSYVQNQIEDYIQNHSEDPCKRQLLFLLISNIPSDELRIHARQVMKLYKSKFIIDWLTSYDEPFFNHAQPVLSMLFSIVSYAGKKYNENGQYPIFYSLNAPVINFLNDYISEMATITPDLFEHIMEMIFKLDKEAESDPTLLNSFDMKDIMGDLACLFTYRTKPQYEGFTADFFHEYADVLISELHSRNRNQLVVFKAMVAVYVIPKCLKYEFDMSPIYEKLAEEDIFKDDALRFFGDLSDKLLGIWNS
ncbi:hypothetical protein M9Y10_004039 [Tritrichomonas musculus]|uniref:Right handed beta helix domain-containing protein n=1 Tax=Tritrichomonas musculus TaxID=1915356 RepID=A0ABR2JRI0_9EUKA